ncbi:MAG TPA: hypothetical protein VNA25_02290 [Phycisphaerae bacterium]|nr:hypothetical protein [Phycisphaerae bacterium]
MQKRIALLVAVAGLCLYVLIGYGVVPSKADDGRAGQDKSLPASAKPVGNHEPVAGDAQAGPDATAARPQVHTASSFLATAVDILIRQDTATAAVVASGGALLLFLRYRKRLIAGRR